MLSIRGHVLRMAALAWPIIVAELGWMAMGLVDTVMVAPLGKEAIGAVGVANILYDTFGIFALGLLLGLDPAGGPGLRRWPPRRPTGICGRASGWRCS
jgi:Na+-driven multidrug efflux pump